MNYGVSSTWLVLAVGVIFSHALSQPGDNSALNAVTTGNNAFSSELYDVLRKSNSKDNLIVSPLSVSTVLAMLQAGARGDTATALRNSLKFPQNDEQLNNGYHDLLQQMKSDGNFTLEMANKLYPAMGYQLNSSFTSTLKQYFAAEPQQLDYKKADLAASTINKFVSDTTRDKIKDLISASDLGELTRLVLVNAIYFKGTWKNQFPKEDTSPMDFFIGENETVKVDMMKIETEMLYSEIPELDAKCVSLPYKGDRLSMLILLPNKKTGLTEMENKLKTYPIQQILDKLRERKVLLFLPKFKLESTIDLKEPLQKLGAGAIFSDQADLSGIPAGGKEKLYVSKAIQKAFIEVNEEGSEAAAATGLGIMPLSALIPEDDLIVKVEHAFLSSIYDEMTKTPIFMTTLVNPTQTVSKIKSDTQTSDASSLVCGKSSFSWNLLSQLILITVGVLLL